MTLVLWSLFGLLWSWPKRRLNSEVPKYHCIPWLSLESAEDSLHKMYISNNVSHAFCLNFGPHSLTSLLDEINKVKSGKLVNVKTLVTGGDFIKMYPCVGRKRRKKADDAAFCLACWQLTKPFGKMALSAQCAHWPVFYDNVQKLWGLFALKIIETSFHHIA